MNYVKFTLLNLGVQFFELSIFFFIKRVIKENLSKL